MQITYFSNNEVLIKDQATCLFDAGIAIIVQFKIADDPFKLKTMTHAFNALKNIFFHDHMKQKELANKRELFQSLEPFKMNGT